MLKILTILLLCGLLPFQEATAQEGSPLTAVVNTKDLEKSLVSVVNGLLKTVLGSLSEGSQGSSTGGAPNKQSGTPNKQSGLLGGLLGRKKRDLLGGVLGGQNSLLGGVLGGQNGLLGGVLGGQNGLLGGVLGGKDNLLGGLLGGKNGVLGNLLKLLNLKIADATLLDIKLKTLPGVGLQLSIHIRLEILGNSEPSGPLADLLRILVEVNIGATLQMEQGESGAPKLVVKDCLTDVVNIELLSGTLLGDLLNLLSNTLDELLPGLLCPVVQIVVNLLNTLLGTVNAILPMGTLGSVHYTLSETLFKDENVLLNLNLNLGDKSGNTMNHVPAELNALPPMTDDASKLLISTSTLSPLLELLAKGGRFDADITQQMLSGAVPMTTSALQSILPGISGLLPANMPLVVKIRISDTPLVSWNNGDLTVTLKATIEILAKTRSGHTPLLTLEADIELVGQVKVSESGLRVSLALKKVDLRLVSSQIGDIDVKLLEKWILNILQVGYLPLVNVALDTTALPLPKILNLGYTEGQATIVENTIVAPLAPALP